MKLLIGIDLGTSAMKLLLMSADGTIHNTVTQEYPLEFPQPGWSQQNPEDWKKALFEGLPELLTGFDASTVAGIGCGGQMHGLVVLDENDNVIRPAILWNDGRTAKQVDYLNNVIGKNKLSALTANIAFAGFTAINGMQGSIDANQGDYLLGWDTDEFPFNVYETTMCMYEVLKAGGLTGGFNFDAKNRRPSYTMEDMFHAYILGMDAFALGLIKAAKIIENGRIDGFIADRYASYNTGIGAKIRSGEATLEELATYAEAMGAPELPGSGRQEYLESIVNNILFCG